MKQLLTYIAILSCIIAQNLQASQLDKISRVDNKDIIQLYFYFDTPPEFTDLQSKRRIDLVFFDSSPRPKFKLLEEDDKVVKILSRQSDDKLTLSLFFRYKPQNYSLQKSRDGNIVFEVLLGNEYSRTYENLADRLKGLTFVNRPRTDTTNPYVATPYTKNWLSFFSQYESPVSLSVPVSYNHPPFPIVGLLPPEKEGNLSIFTKELLEFANQGLWDTLAVHILERLQNTKDLKKQKLLALTYGEVLGRGGDFAGAYKQLYLLKNEFSDEIIGTYAGFLLAQLRFVYENSYIALQDYLALDPLISNKSPLAPYFLLAKIDASLATGDYQSLNKLLLIDDIALPPDVAEKIRIRQADYWFVMKKSIQAFASYRLQLHIPALNQMPFSLAGLSNTLYDQKKYELAAQYYKQLASLISDEEELGLVSFRRNMAQLKFEKKETLLDNFSQIENSFPNTEAGFRAALKKNDLLYLSDRNWATNALTNYRAIGINTTIRSIKEEALLKQAIIHTQLDEKGKAIKLAQKILREFQTGTIRTVTQALLIDILPDQIKKLVDGKKYVEALVLAKQNRLLFENNWLNNKFLADIAEAYHQIGIYDEAQKLYLYLIGVASVERREGFFLPMILSTFNHGNFSLVEEYAAQYFYNYPNGSYADEILFIRLQALVADERLQEAINLLPAPLPNTKEFNKFAALLYFRTDNYENCLKLLKRLLGMGLEFSGQEQFMYSESLYQTGDYMNAMDSFKKIKVSNIFYEQSLYRQAELERLNGNEKKALTLFEKIVETGKDTRWKKYAERELLFAQTADKI